MTRYSVCTCRGSFYSHHNEPPGLNELSRIIPRLAKNNRAHLQQVWLDALKGELAGHPEFQIRRGRPYEFVHSIECPLSKKASSAIQAGLEKAADVVRQEIIEIVKDQYEPVRPGGSVDLAMLPPAVPGETTILPTQHLPRLYEAREYQGVPGQAPDRVDSVRHGYFLYVGGVASIGKCPSWVKDGNSFEEGRTPNQVGRPYVSGFFFRSLGKAQLVGHVFRQDLCQSIDILKAAEVRVVRSSGLQVEQYILVSGQSVGRKHELAKNVAAWMDTVCDAYTEESADVIHGEGRATLLDEVLALRKS